MEAKARRAETAAQRVETDIRDIIGDHEQGGLGDGRRSNPSQKAAVAECGEAVDPDAGVLRPRGTPGTHVVGTAGPAGEYIGSFIRAMHER